jgi:kynureninase
MGDNGWTHAPGRTIDDMQSESHDSDVALQDAGDELAHFRASFHQPPGIIYLEANSLGLFSREAEAAVLHALEEWRTHGISGWLSASPPWYTLAEQISGLMAPLVGAVPEEVGVGDSTTINLHKFLAGFYQPSASRPRIVTDELSFPSDLYALQSHLRLRGRDPTQDLVKVPSRDGYTIEGEAIVRAMTEDVQIVVLPAVHYQGGQLLDIAWLAQQARERGILLAVDCSHSVGVVPHRLSEWGVDFAFWCTYKYLNSGPGGVAAWFLHRKHFDRPPGMAGWFASRKERQFDMARELDPAPDAGRLQVGTPHILSMASLLGTLKLIAEAGIERIRLKSLRLTAFLMELADARLAQFGFRVITPREEQRRGGHVSLAHPEALRICKALRGEGVIVDHRPPNLVRLGPSPLVTSYADCCEAIRRLETIMQSHSYKQYSVERDLVS